MSVLLSKPLFKGVSQQEVVQQLEGKKKAQSKLPSWFKNPKIYYPKKLHLEQTSSEATANYKSQFLSGKRIIDLTGGFGVDVYYFCRQFEKVHYCEIDHELHEITLHNAKIFDLKNLTTYRGDGIEFLKKTTDPFDWIYVDPSRRDEDKKRVFKLSDCSPNVVEHLDLFFNKAKSILIKTSPLLDLTAGLKELKHVQEIHIAALENEVKEVLWILNRNDKAIAPLIKTVNLSKGGDTVFEFDWEEEKVTTSDLGAPMRYLYEPNAAILKSGGFKILGKQLGLLKLHEHSHLYTSTELIPFPGRTFEIIKIIPYNKKNLKGLDLPKANISTRNFPLSVAQLRSLSGIKDGGHDYLFFTTNAMDERIILCCKKA